MLDTAKPHFSSWVCYVPLGLLRLCTLDTGFPFPFSVSKVCSLMKNRLCFLVYGYHYFSEKVASIIFPLEAGVWSGGLVFSRKMCCTLPLFCQSAVLRTLPCVACIFRVNE